MSDTGQELDAHAVNDAARRGFHEAFISLDPKPAPAGRWWRSWVRLLGWPAGLIAFVVAISSSSEWHRGPSVLVPFAAALLALPYALSRTRELVGWRIAVVLALLSPVLFEVTDNETFRWPIVLFLALLLLYIRIVLRRDLEVVVWVWAVMVVLTWLMVDADNRIGLAVMWTAIAVVGQSLHARLETQRRLREQEEVSELERARRTVLEERARIARDLHDVVAHHMSMVVVQAESAPYRMPDLSAEARDEFASIGGSAREALNEIRALLSVLRAETQDVELAPQPGLDELDDLVEGARRAGVSVDLDITGTPRQLRTAVGLAAYRIVQESLANAARHAPGAPVRVAVGYGDDVLDVRVVNAAPDVAIAPGPAGHGLTGMRERVDVVRGTLDAGPTVDGGFEVSASLPTEDQPATQDEGGG